MVSFITLLKTECSNNSSVYFHYADSFWSVIVLSLKINVHEMNALKLVCVYF